MTLSPQNLLVSVYSLGIRKHSFFCLKAFVMCLQYNTVQVFLSLANGGNIVNMPLIEHILQVTVSSKTNIIGRKEGGTITNKRKFEGPISQPKSLGLV